MFKVLIIIALGALVLLTTVTIILVKMNWGEKLYNPLLSLFLVGAVTTFVTVLLLLKGETIESSFTTLIVIDSQNHLPPFPSPDSSTRNNKHLSTYHKLSSPIVIFQGIEETLFPTPQNNAEEITFYEELLQYVIFRELIDMHYQSQSLSQGVAGVSSSTYNPFKLTETEEKPLIEFESQLSKNRFSKDKIDSSMRDVTFAKLPKGTTVEFTRTPSSENTGVEKHTIILSKPNYFSIEIIIGAGFTTGLNSVPPGLALASEIVKFCKTSMFTISIVAKFEKITAGNWRTEELKNWAKWMSKELESRLSEDKLETVGTTATFPLHTIHDIAVKHSSISKVSR